jgi:hypothetical protein
MSKSHVSMEQHQCIVCLTLFDTGAILLNKRLAQTLEPRTVTGHGLCPECNALNAEYVALVECNNDKTRTGVVGRVRRSVWGDIFNVPCPETMGYVEVGLLSRLSARPIDELLAEERTRRQGRPLDELFAEEEARKSVN